MVVSCLAVFEARPAKLPLLVAQQAGSLHKYSPLTIDSTQTTSIFEHCPVTAQNGTSVLTSQGGLLFGVLTDGGGEVDAASSDLP